MKNEKAPVPQAQVAASILDLSMVDDRPSNVYAPCITLSYDSFTGKTTAMAVPVMDEVTREAGVGNAKASGAKVVRSDMIPPATVYLLLCAERNASTLPINWVEAGTRATINMRKLLKLRPFEVPRNTVAYIPVTKGSIENFGSCLVLHFGDATFREIEPGKKKSAKTGKESKEPTNETKAGTAESK